MAGHQRCNDVYFSIENDQAGLIIAALEIVVFFDILFVAFKNGLDYPIPTRDFSPFPTMFLNLPQSLLSLSRVSVQRLFSSTGWLWGESSRLIRPGLNGISPKLKLFSTIFSAIFTLLISSIQKSLILGTK